MRIKPLETGAERQVCLEIAKALPEWFNEAGVKAIERGFEVLVVKTFGGLSYQPYDETRRFYEKKGFARVALIDPYPKWGKEALIYVKFLRKG
ncbi:hypothetical protein [Thermococcus sp. Bubb.Bath]|uniref:hypothetical protein n=1 Tax=Thermococcus sp. Bubb.Bath TaxID=1638242 RepID=UPI001F0D64E6|nr:hypothetical protein [Thermococcus sp. Bubb.Bath]